MIKSKKKKPSNPEPHQLFGMLIAQTAGAPIPSGARKFKHLVKTVRKKRRAK